MIGELFITPMTAADVPDIMAIQKDCHLSPWAANSYLIALKDPDFLLYTAKINSTVVGFTAVRLITSGFICELLNIGVSPSNQHKKIGGGLISQLFRDIKGKSGKISLEVREGNTAAIGFYTKHGFYPIGVRKNYYSDPLENALLMEKMLN